MKFPLAVSLTIAIGLIVLAGYFFPQVAPLRYVFVQWAVILSAVAVIVGVANLAGVHLRKLSSGSPENAYSGILLISLAVTLIAAIAFGPTGFWSQWIYSSILMPAESSLMAILAVSLVYAMARLLRRNLSLMAVVFFVTAIFVLAGSVSWLGVEIPGLHGSDGLRALIASSPAVAGARGILLGIALGTIATGLRVLIGADRPYEDG